MPPHDPAPPTTADVPAAARPTTGRRARADAAETWSVTTDASPDAAAAAAAAAGASAPAAAWRPASRRTGGATAWVRWRTTDRDAGVAVSVALRAAGFGRTTLRKDPTTWAVQSAPESTKLARGARDAADEALDRLAVHRRPVDVTLTVVPGMARSAYVQAALLALAAAVGVSADLSTPPARDRVWVAASVPPGVVRAAADVLVGLAVELRVTFRVEPAMSRSAVITAALRALGEA